MIMDNIATQLTQLQTIKQDIATAIEGKGGTVGEGFDTYATAISNLPDSSGGGTPQIRLSESDVRFGHSNFTSIPNWIIVDAVPQYCFHNTGLTSITIPNTVTSIGYYAFAESWSLSSVTIPNSVTHIGTCAFAWCYSLSSLSLGNSIEEIGAQAFSGCPITTLVLPDTIANIRYAAFENCNYITSITLPRMLDVFGNPDAQEQGVFLQCGVYNTGINLTIPGEISTIPELFCQNANILDLTIEEGITFIGANAFSYTPITSVVLPSTLEYIQDYCFGGTGLEWIKCLATTPPCNYWEESDPYWAGNHFDDTNDCPIYVPDQSVTAYQNHPYWANYINRIKPMSDFATDFPNA